MKGVVREDGSVTAGNSSQTSDGAGALILASEKAVKQFGLKPLARFVSFAIKGVPPHIMGIGPIEAIPAALRLAGLTLDDLGWIELNEAFAAQSLAVIGSLGLDAAKVNPMGGAIALGHPLGATGAIRAATPRAFRVGSPRAPASICAPSLAASAAACADARNRITQGP